MLQCHRTRRRIGAYLDGALDARETTRAAAHLASCDRCRAEADGLRRLSTVLRLGVESPVPPAWTGLWEGIRRGIETPHRVEPAAARLAWRPRLALGAAAALLVAGAMVLWQTSSPPPPQRTVAAISVSSADTDHVDRTVMVYTPPERDLAVVWIFDRD